MTKFTINYLGVIIDYEVRSLGELWKLESPDEPRCYEKDACIDVKNVYGEYSRVRLVECG